MDGLPVAPFHHALGALGPIAAAFFVSPMETGQAGAVSSPLVVTIIGALVTFWGIIVVIAAGPRYWSRRGKVVTQRL